VGAGADAEAPPTGLSNSTESSMTRTRTCRSLLFRLHFACALALLLAPPARLAGQTSAPDASAPPAEGELSAADGGETPTWNERIVVTASRGERLADDVPLHVSVVDPLDPAAATDMAASDLVGRAVPSLNLQVANSSLVAAPRDQGLNFRGVSGASVSHALLLVDGLPMLDPYNGSAIWSKVPKSLIERVEVVPGGGATVWGNLALSGVVNLITRAPSESTLEASLRLASHDTVGLSATYSDIAGDWAGWVALDHFTTDGYLTVEPRSRGAADERESRQYDSLTVHGSHTFSPRAVLHLRTLGYLEERAEGTHLDRAENDEWMASASLDLVADARTTWQLRLFGRRQSLEDFTGAVDATRDSVTPSAHIFDLASDNLGGGAVWSRARSPRHTLSVGADFQQLEIERGELLDYTAGQFTRRYDVTGEQQLGGGFVESRWRLGEHWSAQAAMRFDAIRTSGGGSRRIDLASGALLDQERLPSNSETTANPSVGFSYQATPASRLRGAAYTGFRSPVPSELFVGAAPRNNRETAPNPELDPERLVGGELGYDFTPSRRVSARATAFWSEIEDLIERVTLGRVGPAGGIFEPCGSIGPNGSCTQRRNLGRTRSYGVEVDGEYRPHPHWRLTFGATLLDAQIRSNPALPELVGNDLEHTPAERAVLGIVYAPPERLSIALRVRHVGDRWTEAENENLLPAHTVVDLSLSRRLQRGFELFAGAENLLDEEFLVDFGSGIFRVGPGRILQLGLRYRRGG
jgi:outer membrane receptor protein involved in Fe transport